MTMDRLSAALSDRSRIERFVVEIKTTAALSHPRQAREPVRLVVVANGFAEVRRKLGESR